LLKLIELHRELDQVQEMIQTIQQFLPGSSMYELVKSFEIPSPSNIWKLCCEAQENCIQEYVKTEVNTRRTRLAADPLEVIKQTVEMEALEKYPLKEYYEQYLNLDLEEEENIQIANKYLALLDRMILYSPIEEKKLLRETVKEVCDSLFAANTFSEVACRIELEEQNSALKEYQFDRINPFRLLFEGRVPSLAKFLQAFYQWKDGGQTEDALLNVTEGLEIDPDSIFGYHLLLLIHVQLADWESVIQTAERFGKILRIFSEQRGLTLDIVGLELELVLAHGYLVLLEQFTTQCLTAYRALLEKYPNHIEANLGLGKALLGIGKYKDAQIQFQKVLEQDAANQDAILDLGWTYHKLGDQISALEWFKRKEALDNNYLIHYRRACVYWEMGDIYRTEKEYCHSNLVEAIKMNPHFSPSFTCLGHYYLRHENDVDRASKCYSKAVAIDPSDSDAVRSIIDVWLSQNRFHESKTLLEQFTLSNPRSDWAWKRLGLIVMEDDPEASITSFQSSLRIQPNDANAWNALGEAYSNAGKYVAALKALDRSIQIDNTLISTHFLKGVVFQRLGMFGESASSFEMCLDCAPEKGKFPVLKSFAETLLWYGSDLFEQGAFGSALSQYISGLETCIHAIQLDSDSSISVLKLAGDICLQLYKNVRNLVTQKHLLVIEELVSILKITFDSTMKNVELLFEGGPIEKTMICAIYCYRVCLTMTKSTKLSAIFYRDTSTALFFLSQASSQDAFDVARKYCNMSLSLVPTDPLSWNTLGVLTKRSDPSLSQHSFIQSLLFDETVSPINLEFTYMV
jgi:superkiller protein 3